MREAVWAEVLKARRSRLPGITALAFVVAAGVGGLFMFILLDPDRARALGLLGAKAQFAGTTADWPAYFALLAQTVAVGGLLVFGLIVIWLFGREFSDRTAKDLLALPTSRAAIVGAKFVVAGAWSLLLAVQLCALGLVVGWLLRLPGWSPTVAWSGIGRVMAAAALTVLLVTTFAVAASAARGYLAAVGVMFGTVFLAQIVAALGYGHVFPWSVPAVLSGVSGEQRPAVGTAGYVLVVLVGVVSVAATTVWWRTADQSR